MITTTYETSKALWNAGVRIENYLTWKYSNERSKVQILEPYLIFNYRFSDVESIPAPTFTELVEWLKSKGFAIELKPYTTNNGVEHQIILYEYQGFEDVYAPESVDLTEAAAECCMDVMRREGR